MKIFCGAWTSACKVKGTRTITSVKVKFKLSTVQRLVMSVCVPGALPLGAYCCGGQSGRPTRKLRLLRLSVPGVCP